MDFTTPNVVYSLKKEVYIQIHQQKKWQKRLKRVLAFPEGHLKLVTLVILCQR